MHCGVRRISVSSTTQCRRSVLSPFGECDNIGISSIFPAVFESFRGSRAYEKADVPFLACTEALRDNNSWQNLDDLLKPYVWLISVFEIECMCAKDIGQDRAQFIAMYLNARFYGFLSQSESSNMQFQ